MGYNFANIRKLVSSAFLADEFDTFCSDYYYEEVYRNFTDGQKMDQRVRMLIDHVRVSEGFELLLQRIEVANPNVFAKYAWGLRAEAAAGPGEEVAPPVLGSGNFPRNRASESYTFDLTTTVETCLGLLLKKKNELVGFSVCCDSPLFLKNLCQRLKYEMGRPNVINKDLWVISPTHNTIERLVMTIKRYRALLKSGTVLVAVSAPHEEAAERFWQSLRNEFKGELENRLIVILAVASAHCVPEGTTLLAPPCFTEAHIFQWVREIVTSREWPADFIDYWTVQMKTECSVSDELDVQWVYEYLQDMIERLQQCSMINDFRNYLIERGQVYVSS